MADDAPDAPEETIDELAGSGWSDGALIDVRSAEEFASGHVPGAANVPLEDVLADPRAAVPQGVAGERVHVICQSGRRSLKAATALIEAGVPAVSVAGGTTAWIEDGRPVDT